ncbi:MAG: UDP-N-acetylmuramoyl-L-alanine--D-glutamate ligase [Bacteroidia bacterium]
MIAILGAGESGIGAARLARWLGRDVWVSDAGRIQPVYRQVLEAERLPYEEGGHTEAKFFEAACVIKSPGIPDTAPLVRALLAAGREVISEIEFGARHARAPIIAITGSNGKTTTTSLVHHMLVQAGVEAGLGGNIGESFAGMVAGEEVPECYVLEVSSFQLDNIVRFRPAIALLLNITPDHLDRYGYSMDSYGAAKFRIGMNQHADDHFIYCLDDPETMRQLPSHRLYAQHRPFSLDRQAASAAWVEDGWLVVGGEQVLPLSELPLLGPHNQRNALAALLAVGALGIAMPDAAAGLRSFRPIAHRLEPVGTHDGVLYINDSKATNVDAVYHALQGMDRPVVLLAGGVDKGNDYTVLQPLVRDKVRAIVVLGQHREKIDQAFDCPIFQAMSMAEAVAVARREARPGDVVLLSPACASFDLFRNYEDRGDQFRAAVQGL